MESLVIFDAADVRYHRDCHNVFLHCKISSDNTLANKDNNTRICCEYDEK